MVFKSMAVSANVLSLLRQSSVAGNHQVDLKNQFLGGRVMNLGFYYNREKWKGNSGVKVRAAVEASVEGTKGKALEKTFGLDVVSEGELMVKGFKGLRKTKLVCTVGPACSSLEDLEKLALGGMNVARLNICHGSRDWHRDVIRKIKKFSEEKGFSVSVMIDTEGSQIQVVDYGAPSSVKVKEGSIWRFTAEHFEGSLPLTVQANYRGFSEGGDIFQMVHRLYLFYNSMHMYSKKIKLATNVLFTGFQ